MTEEAKKAMTKDEVINMLKTRTKKDGTPFKKHEGPRKQRAVSAEGLKVALDKQENPAVKVALAQAFGTDGRKALRELAEKDSSYEALLEAAFPGTGSGRPYLDAIKVTADGKAVISGFEPNSRVKVERQEDGTVVLTQLEADAADAEAPKTEATAVPG